MKQQKYKTAFEENGTFQVGSKQLSETQFRKLQMLMLETGWIIFTDKPVRGGLDFRNAR